MKNQQLLQKMMDKWTKTQKETKNKQKDNKIIEKVEVILKTGQMHSCKMAKIFEMEVDRKRHNRRKKRENMKRNIQRRKNGKKKGGEVES